MPETPLLDVAELDAALANATPVGPSPIVLGPGIYPDVAWDDYIRIDAISCHTLMWGRVSMQHLRAALDGKLQREDTPALSFGRALHTRLLEPDTFAARYIVMPGFGDMRSSKNREARDAWLAGEGAGKEPLTQDEYDRIQCAAAAVRDHKAVKLLRAAGQCEVTIVWEAFGMTLRSKLDKLIGRPRLVLDVKKVAAATSPDRAPGTADNFSRTIAGYGYAMQAAMYVDAVKHATGEDARFIWCCVEDDYPHSVGVYEAEPATIEAGRAEYRTLLAKLKACRDSGNWPGLSDDVEWVAAPYWYTKKWSDQ